MIEELDACPLERALVLTADPFSIFRKPEECIPEKHRRRRDAAWRQIEPIVTAPNGGAFDPNVRGGLIRQAVERTGGSKKHLYRRLRRYWQAGMTPNALLPDFHHCGAPGKERNAGTAKRGRPRRLTKLEGAPPGINIGPAEAENLHRGYRMFYDKTPEDGGRSLKVAYLQTLRRFFHAGFERQGGVMVEVLAPADQLPSFAQFLYWARKGTDVRDSLLRRHGERRFNLSLRPVLGDSTLMAQGPGSLVQIDSTVTDVWIVSCG